MIQGAIFDVDGTLLDSMSNWTTIGERYLHSIGYEPKEGLNETIRSMSLYQAACYCKSEYGITRSVEEIMAGVNGLVEHYYRNEASLKPGAAEFLAQLKRCGVKMCIATATDRYLVEAGLERCGIRDYFSELFTCGGVGHGKDEPVIYQNALAHLQTSKHHTVVFEDAFYAAETAKKDGFPVVAVYDPHEKKQAELQALSDFHLTRYSDFDLFWRFASEL